MAKKKTTSPASAAPEAPLDFTEHRKAYAAAETAESREAVVFEVAYELMKQPGAAKAGWAAQLDKAREILAQTPAPTPAPAPAEPAAPAPEVSPLSTLK